MQANATSVDFGGYGLWCIYAEPIDGGAILFTFQYMADSVTIINDPSKHRGRLWEINKSSAGDTFSITNLQSTSTSMWIVNLTLKHY